MTKYQSINQNGFTIFENIFSKSELQNIKNTIEKKQATNANFRKGKALFAIRNFLEEFPELRPLLLTKSLRNLLFPISDSLKLVKAIYFDKPPKANWVVNWHQDLTINVTEKKEVKGYRNWTKKSHGFAVQPPLTILENMVTLRIHLDDCKKENGALRVIPKSHLNGMLDVRNLAGELENEVICELPAGGVLMMHPLILHASRRTENEARRRVIHLEFSGNDLAQSLNWRES